MSRAAIHQFDCENLQILTHLHQKSRFRRALRVSITGSKPHPGTVKKPISLSLNHPSMPLVPSTAKRGLSVETASRGERRSHIQDYVNRKLKELNERQQSPKSNLNSMEAVFQFGSPPHLQKRPIRLRNLSNQVDEQEASSGSGRRNLGSSQKIEGIRIRSRPSSPQIDSAPSFSHRRASNTPPQSTRATKREQKPTENTAALRPTGSSEKLVTMNTTATLESQEEKNAISIYVKTHFEKYNECPQTTLEFYKVGKLLGKGAFGKVISAVHKLTGIPVALKAIDKEYMADERHRRKVFQEVFILNKIKHRRVIKILEVFESTNHLLIAMEFAGGGDLLQYVKSRGKLTELEAKMIYHQVIEGALAIHRHGVLHRDFKLDNILLDSQNHVKICDFGVSRLMRKGQRVNEQCGTPAYIAPEIIADRGYEGYTADIWSLGVCLYAMINGAVPFKAQTLKELHKLVLTAKFSLPDTMSSEAKDLVTRMLHLVPAHRISLQDVLTHPWFTVSPAPLYYEDCTDYDLMDIGILQPDKEAVAQVRLFGFPQEQIISALRINEMNHATASYYLVLSSFL